MGPRSAIYILTLASVLGSEGVRDNLTVLPEHRLPVLGAFRQACDQAVENGNVSIDLVPTIWKAHRAALDNVRYATAHRDAYLPPVYVPNVTTPGRVILAVVDESRACLEQAAEDMTRELAREREGIDGGSLGEHDMKKLMESLGRAGDRNAAVAQVCDILYNMAIRLQGPSERAMAAVLDMAAALGTAADKIRVADTLEAGVDDEMDEEE